MKTRFWISRPLFILLCAGLPFTASLRLQAIEVGMAKIDVSPAAPIRLSGYGGRRTESTGVAQRLWAKALVVGSDAEGAALLLTVDNCGVS